MARQLLQPWHLLLAILSGLVNREQQRAIDYLRTENQFLREKIGKKRIILDDDQRNLLKAVAKMYGVSEDEAAQIAMKKGIENYKNRKTLPVRTGAILSSSAAQFPNQWSSTGLPELLLDNRNKN